MAKEVIAAIDGGLSTQIGMPLYARWIDWYNVLPVGVQKIARRLAQVDTSMKTFVGRNKGQAGANGEEKKGQ